MEEKQIIVQHPCLFTRTGLEQLLTDTSFNCPTRIVASEETLWKCHANLRRFPDVDMLILSLRGDDYTPGDALNLIVDWMQIHRPQCRVVVIADAFCIRLLEHYFYGLNNVCAIFDHTAPLSQLSGQLVRMLEGKQLERQRPVSERLYPLSKREQCILGSLLQGKTTIDIAHSLQLSYKTISYYKRSALNKLGIRTFHPLLINEHNVITRVMSQEVETA